MPGKRKPATARAYFDALRKAFALQSEILTAVLPHMGERGRNDEERIRAFLRSVLPRKFGVGTGFVASSNPNLPISRQIDVVIYDDLHNAPLHPELAAHVFPVEMVYGCVEVKGTIRPRDLAACIRSIASVRALKATKQYAVMELAPIETDEESSERPRKPPVRDGAAGFKPQTRLLSSRTAPRAFVVAFDAVGWSSAESFAQSWARALLKGGAHIHGAVVLNKEWSFSQVAHVEDGVQLKVYKADALLRFHQNLLESIQGLYIAPAHMAPYYNLPATESPEGFVVSVQQGGS